MSSTAATVRPDRSDLDWADDSAWEARFARDRATARLHQNAGQREITQTLLSRAIAGEAAAFALTGSTARDRRTSISDLDYHVIGARPEYRDLPDEIDIVAYDVPTLFEKLRSGDDYVQWTLRYGCMLYDTGVFRHALAMISEERLWPRSDEKLARLAGQIALAQRLAEAGDREGAQAETRATFTSAARALLLRAGTFPLARSELPEQLRQTGFGRLAELLERTIYTEVPLEQLVYSLDGIESGELLVAESGPVASGKLR